MAASSIKINFDGEFLGDKTQWQYRCGRVRE